MLTKLTHDVLSLLDSKKQVTIRLGALDFSKAFDSVEPALLISKLSSYEFPRWSISWLFSFLSNREQFIQHKSSKSSLLIVNRGIPQGTVLGPLLFSVMIEDLQFNYPRTLFYKYADDQTLLHWYCPGETDNFEDLIMSVKGWCCINNLVLNPQKKAKSWYFLMLVSIYRHRLFALETII